MNEYNLFNPIILIFFYVLKVFHISIGVSEKYVQHFKKRQLN